MPNYSSRCRLTLSWLVAMLASKAEGTAQRSLTPFAGSLGIEPSISGFGDQRLTFESCTPLASIRTNMPAIPKHLVRDALSLGTCFKPRNWQPSGLSLESSFREVDESSLLMKD